MVTAEILIPCYVCGMTTFYVQIKISVYICSVHPTAKIYIDQIGIWPSHCSSMSLILNTYFK